MLLDLQWSLPQQGSITLDRLQDGLSLPRSEFAQIQFDIDTLVFTNCFAYILICPLTKRAKIKQGWTFPCIKYNILLCKGYGVCYVKTYFLTINQEPILNNKEREIMPG